MSNFRQTIRKQLDTHQWYEERLSKAMEALQEVRNNFGPDTAEEWLEITLSRAPYEDYYEVVISKCHFESEEDSQSRTDMEQKSRRRLYEELKKEFGD